MSRKRRAERRREHAERELGRLALESAEQCRKMAELVLELAEYYPWKLHNALVELFCLLPGIMAHVLRGDSRFKHKVLTAARLVDADGELEQRWNGLLQTNWPADIAGSMQFKNDLN